ncbi:MAG: alpha/beta fold hydrolase [Deltaproteobacteria bacterium]|nr:alpha/beta fold hydrolase [Deltaproteobacteria bacterium]
MSIFFKLFRFLLAGYVLLCLVLYFSQEKLIFAPVQLESEHQFSFPSKFEEIQLTAKDGAVLSGLHFYAKKSGIARQLERMALWDDPKKAAILFFHGNAGNLDDWGTYNEFFTNLGHDFFIFDYRGFGKSAGRIGNEKTLLDDANLMFERVLKDFKKDRIVVVGYSIGSGVAAEVAANFGISKLVLVGPYFRFDELAREKFPFVPRFLVKFKIPTADFLQEFAKKYPASQTYIFHGTHDSLINISHSRRLAELSGKGGAFFPIDCGHDDILDNAEFLNILGNILHESSE